MTPPNCIPWELAEGVTVFVRESFDYFWPGSPCCDAAPVPMIPNWPTVRCATCSAVLGKSGAVALTAPVNVLRDTFEAMGIARSEEPLTACLLADCWADTFAEAREGRFDPVLRNLISAAEARHGLAPSLDKISS